MEQEHAEPDAGALVAFQRESLASPNSSDGDLWIRRLQQPPVAAGCADESRKRIRERDG